MVAVRVCIMRAGERERESERHRWREEGGEGEVCYTFTL